MKEMERRECDGGDLKNCKMMDMKCSEYSRESGSDGFSKTGGKGNGFKK